MAKITVELVKALLLVIVLLFCLKVASALRVRPAIANPLFLPLAVALYLLTLHGTIRGGAALSTIAPFGAVLALSVGVLAIARSLLVRRETRFISHYKLLEQIGKGGMGTVYRAQEIHTKTIVALKVLSEELMIDPENRRRLANEGQLLSSFSHPHIVKVFEVGETTDRGYIAMEYLPGGTLKERMPVAVGEAKRILLEIASGLEEIHRCGIIHRDIKTGNLMLDETGSVRIMDFGLSKAPLVTMMTTMGTVIGTLGYVAPEQVTNMNVDHRVDLFSFGVVMYELLTGNLPFRGENEIAVIHAIFNTVPPAPSSLRTGLPAALDRIVGRCLAKSPSDRFASATELRVALDGDFW
jgi:serine/threonine-protein kinase